MAVVRKTLFPENLENYQTFLTDTNPNSTYFKISELPDVFTGGKNAFLIQGSEYLVPDTLIKIEIKDSKGNIIYHEAGEGFVSASVNGESIVTEYYEGVSKVIAVHIYPNKTTDINGNVEDGTAYGPATITILGEVSSYINNGLVTPIPIEWEGQYNVKWQTQINVNPSLANTTKIRFYKRPVANITETLSPIYTIVDGVKVQSNIVSSFANVKLSQIDTFAGDVKRIKVFRTSLGDISDADLIQDILVESKELLTSYELSGSVVGNAGLFTSETLEKLWIADGVTTQLTSSRIDNGVKLDGNGYFKYSSSLNLSDGNIFELGIDAFYSSSTASNLGIYISGSNNGEYLISTLNGVSPTKNLKDQTIQFSLPLSEPTASLYLSQSQGEWHVGNVSLKLSQDSAFSPSEIDFVTSMPTVVGNETYKFNFEFYDVNNNYVPVAVTQSAVFTGGNNNIGGTLIFISASASASSAELAAVSSSISGTVTVNSSSANTTIVTLSGSVSGTIGSVSSSVSSSITSLSGSVSGSITSLSGSVSGSITTLSSSVSSSITTLSSSVSQSVYQSLLTSFARVQNLANGNFSGSFIGDNVIYSPVLGGQLGYFSTLFKVGQSPNSIYLDARQTPRKIFIGGIVPSGDTEASGAFNNTNTPVYFDSTGKLSLGNKLSWNGVDTLSITGNINVGSSVPNSVVTGLKALALKDSVSATEIDAGAVTEGKIGSGAVSNAKIAADAITEAKLAVNAVTEGKISANAIVADKIAANAIVADKIAAGAITAGKISAGAITADKIEAGAITAGKIAAGAITADKIEAGAITAGKIAAGAVTADKVDVAGVISAGSIVVGGSNISALNNNSGYQNNSADKTAGSVGGWTISGTNIKSNNNQTIFYNTGIISLTDGSTEKILITKDALTKASTTANLSLPSTGNLESSQTHTVSSFSYMNTFSYETTSTATSGQFTAQGSSVILNVSYGGGTTSTLTGTISWNQTLSNFKYVQNTTSKILYVNLYNSANTLIESKQVTVYYRQDIGSSLGYTFPYVGGGNTSVAFSGLATGTNYYAVVSVTKRIQSAYIAWVFNVTSLSAQWTYYGMQGSNSPIDISAAGEKTSIGVNGMIASSAGGFAQVGPVASIGGTPYSAAFLGNVRVNGEIQASSLVSSSDERLKTNIIDIESPLLVIEKLKPKSFVWNNKLAPFSEQKNSFGFIAQDVEKDFPFLVKNIGDNEDIDNVLSLDYNAIIPINTAAIKQLLAKIEELEERILELENN
jgi:hypothetical protein